MKGSSVDGGGVEHRVQGAEIGTSAVRVNDLVFDPSIDCCASVRKLEDKDAPACLL